MWTHEFVVTFEGTEAQNEGSCLCYVALSTFNSNCWRINCATKQTGFTDSYEKGVDVMNAYFE